MTLNNFVSGKIFLNEYVHRLEQNGAVFNIPYWGAMPNHYNTLHHKHSFFEVCYVVEGEGTYIDGDDVYPLKRNTIFLSRPGVSHQIKSEQGLFLVYVAFQLVESESSDEWITIIENAKHCPKIIFEVNEDTVPVLLWKSLLIQASEPKHDLLKEALTNLAGSLIFSIIHSFVPISKKEESVHLPAPSSQFLKQVIIYIRDNLSDSLKMTDIADHFHVSRRHLSRLFVSEIGMSYSDFVQNERIERAATLLKSTSLSISEIAEESGFSEVHYFTRVFTSKMRNPPGRFRSLYSNLKTKDFTEY
ncbi:AraC family transcriptional regulator [Alteribacillus bidgolensis]|uniref:AraC-like ligand binding domain-containing protein n=1 Tax=Alteribacillus bidgolensis TaxID=930129 RepID=A0A1G8K474_9BACI|nr:AraC family transcriptional regulator [Alteribacillus bidgolensis]SDI38242.1 AraC-like ligand binding domain-containing protein [Alteribacillus bidgolensis]